MDCRRCPSLRRLPDFRRLPMVPHNVSSRDYQNRRSDLRVARTHARFIQRIRPQFQSGSLTSFTLALNNLHQNFFPTLRQYGKCDTGAFLELNSSLAIAWFNSFFAGLLPIPASSLSLRSVYFQKLLVLLIRNLSDKTVTIPMQQIKATHGALFLRFVVDPHAKDPTVHYFTCNGVNETVFRFE